MHVSRDPKAMAKSLRGALARRDIALSHGQCLEVVAQQLGFVDWNTAAAGGRNSAKLLSLPQDWFLAGSAPHDYHAGRDPDRADQVATIYAKKDGRQITGFATLMQSFDAKAYQGKRVRLVGDLSCADTDGLATMWMRVDSAERGGIRFDNMLNRQENGPLIGTQDWTRRAIVLDVPVDAEKIAFGFMLEGRGQCWCRGFEIDVVDGGVAVTSDKGSYLNAPSNLNFGPKDQTA
ncbi:glyoxalase superfamily protein [Cognatiyoonia sp. IB215446]|uniref:glyoxalase superfamily protein n=1 Tax=Cognatiyoonia sp. IB215446 TaxID=3097355 RepID=UPI002A0D21B8|nr:glyoxalase superfamily protein [Cognatiyoonia sp. IB215446]MDX8348259.1 glyoxalase superfamily protein [Cognatiyoonia sp. IB215446]